MPTCYIFQHLLLSPYSRIPPRLLEKIVPTVVVAIVVIVVVVVVVVVAAKVAFSIEPRHCVMFADDHLLDPYIAFFFLVVVVVIDVAFAS